MRTRILIGLIAIVTSCSSGITPAEYIKYVESSTYPYRKTKVINDVEFTLVYVPNEYMALRNSDDGKTYDKQMFEKELESMKGFVYFIFSIQGMNGNDPVKENVPNVTSYNSEMNYLMNDIQYDFKLKAGNETYACVFSNFEDNHGLTTKTSSQLVFEKPRSMDQFRVVYNDKIFNIGPVVFEFNNIKSKKLKI